jgi:BirA family biotin operon repressor/biotin-[acetyl-CoA-carboxylase] ligase
VSLLSETGVAIEAEDFLTILAASYAVYETQFDTYGFEPIRAAWLDRAARLGEVITARTASSETTGTFETVDGRGNLVLRTASGPVSIPAADIYF